MSDLAEIMRLRVGRNGNESIVIPIIIMVIPGTFMLSKEILPDCVDRDRLCINVVVLMNSILSAASAVFDWCP